MAVIKDGDVDYDYKVGTCDRCGKSIVFSYFQPYECYTYKMEHQIKGTRIRKIYCGWNCYCAAKKEYCIKNINKGRKKYAYTESTPCEEWLDSVTPKAEGDNRSVMERLGLKAKPDDRPLRGAARTRSKKSIIAPYFEQIKIMRDQDFGWEKITKILGLNCSSRCVCMNFEKMEFELRHGNA